MKPEPDLIPSATRRHLEARIARAAEFRDDRPTRTAIPRVGEEGPVVRGVVWAGRRR